MCGMCSCFGNGECTNCHHISGVACPKGQEFASGSNTECKACSTGYYSDEYGITNTKTASLLDIFGSVVQGIIPYGAQLVSAVSLTGVSVGSLYSFLYYPYLLGLSAIAFIVIPAIFKKK